MPAAPVVAVNNALVTVNENNWAVNTGAFSDADGNSTVTLTASVGTVVKNNAAGTWSWSFLSTDGADETQVVTITARDNVNVRTTTFNLTVNNVTPFVQTGGLYTPSAKLVHHYSLDGTFADQFGGPSLVAHGGTLGASRYSFLANQGLQLNHGLVNTANYSIEFVMQFATTETYWKKLVDFSNATSDNGLYVAGKVLQFFPGGAGSTNIAYNTDLHIVLTRSAATGETKVYLNGALQAIYLNGTSGAAIALNNILLFFEDDTATARTEAAAGSVDRITIYDGPLSAADVTALARAGGAIPTAVTVDEGQTAQMSGVFHDPGADVVTVTASIGSVSQSTGNHGTWSWSFDADDGPAQTQTVTITATDSDGDSSTTTFSLTVNNIAPTASLTNSGPVSEGSTGTVSFANQLDPSSADTATLHYAYDFDNDGTFDLGDGTYAGSVSAASATVPASFLADGPGARTVSARIIDHDGASNDYSTTITINNAAPSLAADQATFTVGEGQSAVATGTFGDPGDDTVSLTVALGTIVDNGDGSWSWSIPTADGPDDSRTVSVTATDSDGAVTTTTFDLVVNNLAPTLAVNQASVTVDEGQSAGNSGTFGDPGVDTVTLAVSSGTIVDRGDGTWSWSFDSHDGPDDSQTVTVTATDSDGAVTTTTFDLVVNNLAPTVTVALASVTVDEGQSAGNSGTFGDIGVDSVTLAASVGTIVDNGDGTWSWLFASQDGPADSQTVTVTATDSDGAASTITFVLVVNNLAPTVAADQASATVDEGQNAGNSGTFADPGTDTVTLTASVGTVVDNGNGAWSWSLATSDGPTQSQTVTITATDGDGAATAASFNLVVNNVAPTMDSLTSSATGANPAQTGAPVTVQGSFSDPGTADTHHAVINWGDGTQTVLNESDPGMNQTGNAFSAQHSYASAGTFTVTVTLIDDDGDQDVRTTTAVVAAPATGGSVTVRDRVLYIVGSANSDRVTIEKGGKDQLQVRADFLPKNKPVNIKLANIDRIVVELGDGDDRLDIDGKVNVPAVIHGGAGNDSLKSGGGPAVLLGEAGNDELKGGHGRSILIGGAGRDVLKGGEDGAVLIGGTTNRDQDNNALFTALAQWSNNRTLSARSAAIRALVSVFDDFESDLLKGSARSDLVFRGIGDVVKGQGHK